MIRWPAALYSLKTAIAALAALGIALAVGLPMPFWAMTTVYITSNPLSGATRSKSIYRVMGTTLGAAVAVAMVPALVDWPALLSLGLSCWVGFCLAISLLDRSPRAYVMMLAGYTAAIIGFSSVDHPEAIFDVAAARVTEIVLGIACITVSHSVLWPLSVGERLGPKLHHWLHDAEQWLRDAMVGHPDALKDRRKLAVDALDCIIMATHVPYDTSHWREATRVVQAVLYRMLLLMPLLSGIVDRRRALGEDPELENACTLTEAWLDKGTPLDAVPDYLRCVPERRDWRGLLRESFLVRLTQTARVMGESRQLLAALDDPAVTVPPELISEKIPLKLHTDLEHAVLAGLSCIFALMLVCTFWIWTGWVDGAGAAAMTAVFCCLFAALDNPVPGILAFGGAIVASVPVAGFWLFGILPNIDGFAPLCLVLSPPLLLAGYFMMSPRWGGLATASMVGFGSGIAITENYTADVAHFINANGGQVVALAAAVGVTATFRMISADAAIAKLVGRLHRDLARLAGARTPPDPTRTLVHATDQLALISQRLSTDNDASVAGLAEVRVAVNIATIQQLRMGAGRALRVALARLLRAAEAHFSTSAPGDPPPETLLAAIDRALRLTLEGPAPTPELAGELIGTDPAQGRAALVAMRRNLFPDAAPFSPEPAV
ncbi:MAG: FUSC family protein [Sphingomonadales bacterium]|nr:FUSC family protein [Sphingomonadales bacterium]MDE2171595.1 FUSC family protein [Sphingomonadales bacterium]